MRGKVARQIRKIVKFDPNAERTYFDLVHRKKERVLQFGVDDDGKTFVREAINEVDKFQWECTTPARKYYKYFKKYYNNTNIDGIELSQLPSKEELDGIKQQLQEELRTTGSGGVSNGTGSGERIAEQSGEPDVKDELQD